MNSITKVIHPIHREGYIFIAAFAIASLILALIWEPLGWIGVVLTLWCIYFFRDPERFVPQIDGVVVSPADGVVSSIVTARLPRELFDENAPDIEYTRVSIFLNVFNVHVTRTPVSGRILDIEYFHGKFFNASLDKASEHNERNSLLIETPSGARVGVVQIAGLVARRIVCDAKENDVIEAGQRVGIIRFGSRVDVYLPQGIVPQVAVGQLALGGETIIANLNQQSQPITVRKI